MSTAPETPKTLCEGCARPMRPRGVLSKDMPGTMAWGHSGKCKSCVQPNRPGDRPKPAPAVTVTAPEPAPKVPAARQDAHLAHTIKGLDSFMARRNQRARAQASSLKSVMDTREGRRSQSQAALRQIGQVA